MSRGCLRIFYLLYFYSNVSRLVFSFFLRRKSAKPAERKLTLSLTVEFPRVLPDCRPCKSNDASMVFLNAFRSVFFFTEPSNFPFVRTAIQPATLITLYSSSRGTIAPVIYSPGEQSEIDSGQIDATSQRIGQEYIRGRLW